MKLPWATRVKNFESFRLTDNQWWAISFATNGLLWLALFGFRLAHIPQEFWRWRDDAVITLSHARNFVEFGSIGVSPGGDRVEGFSSPLQFALSSGFFSLFPRDYGLYLDLFVLSSIALSGGFLGSLLFQILSARKLPVERAFVFSTALSACVVAVSTTSWSFLGWFVSGMENPLIVVLGLAILCVISRPRFSIASALAMGLLVALLGVTRVELPAFMLPLVVGVLLAIFRGTGQERGYFLGSLVLIPPAILWLLTHAGRLIYFGDLLPNTALVQGKVADELRLVILAGVTIIVVALLLLLHIAKPGNRFPSSLALGASVAILPLYLLGKNGVLGGRIQFLAEIPLAFSALGIALLGLGFLLRLDSPAEPIDLVIPGIVFLPVAQLLVTGPARLDTHRVSAIAIVFLFTWIATILLRVMAQRDELFQRLPAVNLAFIPIVGGLLVVLGSYSVSSDAPRGLCCFITPNEIEILQVSADFADRNLGEGPIPIVANPDLGKISFAKEAILVDLGWLGDPLFARVSSLRPDLEAQYLQRVALPDILESHGWWSCRHAN